jgi:hypothetical protein
MITNTIKYIILWNDKFCEFGDSFTHQIAPNIKDTTIPDFHVSISKAFCIPSATEFA